jgi:hypothetical protein
MSEAKSVIQACAKSSTRHTREQVSVLLGRRTESAADRARAVWRWRAEQAQLAPTHRSHTVSQMRYPPKVMASERKRPVNTERRARALESGEPLTPPETSCPMAHL